MRKDADTAIRGVGFEREIRPQGVSIASEFTPTNGGVGWKTAVRSRWIGAGRGTGYNQIYMLGIRGKAQHHIHPTEIAPAVAIPH
jgi:hypothetical protein